MHEDDRPLLLVVCEDAERLTRTRAVLREAGILPASGRSLTGAISLLSQVRVDGCVLSQPVTPDEARELAEGLERHRPGSVKLYVLEHQPEPLPGWTGCSEADLPRVAAAACLPSG